MSPTPADSDVIVLEGQPHVINKRHHWMFYDAWNLYTHELNQVGNVEDNDDD